MRDAPLVPAVASSLPQLFAPKIHTDRIAGLLARCDFATEETTSIFRHRLMEAPKGVACGLRWVLENARTQADQDAAAAALTLKTDVLWAQLDALHAAHVDPGRLPPGAWQSGEGQL